MDAGEALDDGAGAVRVVGGEEAVVVEAGGDEGLGELAVPELEEGGGDVGVGDLGHQPPVHPHFQRVHLKPHQLSGLTTSQGERGRRERRRRMRTSSMSPGTRKMPSVWAPLSWRTISESVVWIQGSCRRGNLSRWFAITFSHHCSLGCTCRESAEYTSSSVLPNMDGWNIWIRASSTSSKVGFRRPRLLPPPSKIRLESFPSILTSE